MSVVDRLLENIKRKAELDGRDLKAPNIQAPEVCASKLSLGWSARAWTHSLPHRPITAPGVSVISTPSSGYQQQSSTTKLAIQWTEAAEASTGSNRRQQTATGGIICLSWLSSQYNLQQGAFLSVLRTICKGRRQVRAIARTGDKALSSRKTLSSSLHLPIFLLLRRLLSIQPGQ